MNDKASARWISVNVVDSAPSTMDDCTLQAIKVLERRLLNIQNTGTSLPIHITLRNVDQADAHNLETDSGGELVQVDENDRVNVEAVLDVSDGDIRWGVADAFWTAFTSLQNHCPEYVLGTFKATGFEAVRSVLAEFVADPDLVGIFAGTQPEGFPRPADWVSEEYVRLRESVRSRKLAQLIAVGEDGCSEQGAVVEQQ